MDQEILELLKQSSLEEYILIISLVKETEIQKTPQGNDFVENTYHKATVFIKKDSREIIFETPTSKFAEALREALSSLSFIPLSKNSFMKKYSVYGAIHSGYEIHCPQETMEKITNELKDLFFFNVNLQLVNEKTTIYNEKGMNYQKQMLTSSLSYTLINKQQEHLYVLEKSFPIIKNKDLLKEVLKTKQDLLQIKKTVSIKSGAYDLIIDENEMESLIKEIFSALTSQCLFEKASMFEGLLNKKIASEHLTVKENPYNKVFSIDYDTLGHKILPTTIIDRGVLKKFFIDEFYGKKIHMQSTGNSYLSHTFFASYSYLEVSSSISYEEKIRNFSGLRVCCFLNSDCNITEGILTTGLIGLLYKEGSIQGIFSNVIFKINILDLLQKGEFLDNILEGSRISNGSFFLSNAFIIQE